MKEFQVRLKSNIVTNVLAVAVNSVVGIWSTRFLIKNLGVSNYSYIPLFNSIIAYLGVFTLTITSATSRYVGIAIGKDDVDEAVVFYNTTIFLMGLILAALLLPAGAVIYNIDHLFTVPDGKVLDAQLLLCCITLTFLMSSLSSPLLVGAFVTHRFDITNGATIASKLTQVSVLYVLFTVSSPALTLVGVAYLAMAAVLLLCGIFATRKLTPFLKISLRYFRWSAFHELRKMGGWLIVDQVGYAILVSAELMLINRYLGPKSAGLYAPALQCLFLIRTLSVAVSSIFAPIVYEKFGRGDIASVDESSKIAVRFIGSFVALPVSILCGLSHKFLLYWLGPEFSDTGNLLYIMMLPQVVCLSFEPLFALNRGINRVKVPALVTLLSAFGLVAGIVVILTATSFGLTGVATVSAAVFVLKNALFTPLYAARILKVSFVSYFRPLVFSATLTVVTTMGARAASPYVTNVFSLAVAAVVLTAGYCVLLMLLLGTKDRATILTLIKGRRTVRGEC